jgi:hypothetical protein
VTTALAWILTQPLLRAFCIELCARLLSELLSGSKSDPNFRTEFAALTVDLASANTEEEKRHVLTQLKSLRPHR